MINPHLPVVVDPKNPRWYLAKVLDRMLVKRRGATFAKWLIQWIGSLMEDATWEFPNLLMTFRQGIQILKYEVYEEVC